MSVYYKFNSELSYSYVDFDGMHISVSDLKKSILHQKRLGKTADFDLLITNAQTKEEYVEDNCLIPKNTSLIVARIPLTNQYKKPWEQAAAAAAAAAAAQNAGERPAPASSENSNFDLSRMNGSEEDKIQAMMMQSTLDYDPTKFGKHSYQRVRGSTQTGEVPPNYRCHRCQKPGHWIKNCPSNPPGNFHYKNKPESKKMTGIPRTFRDNPQEQMKDNDQLLEMEEKREIPEDLICAICKGIFRDAVMIPCCGSSFCDECVRTALLESEDNECPDCKEKGTSPGSLIPNRFLRNAVTTFLSESSNSLRDKKIPQEEIADELVEPKEPELDVPENEEVPEESVMQDFILPQSELDPEDEAFEEPPEEINATDITENPERHDKEPESDDDVDDNITVTVPPAHLQSRGAAFRDSRLRRHPSHNHGDSHETFSGHSNTSRDATESYDEENSDYGYRQQSSNNPTKPSQNYDGSSHVQGISKLGDDKMNFPLSGPPPNHMQIGGESQNMYHHQQQHPSMYGQNPHHPQQMSSHPSMYQQQGPYHPSSGPPPYFPAQGPPMRPMRFDHQGNYQQPIRHHQQPMHHHHRMMRPMHDTYNMRHQAPPTIQLSNAVTQNIQQRFGTGIIDDPLEAFNRIMKEKELLKERHRRSPVHNNERRSRSFERKRSPNRHYSPDNRDRQKSPARRRLPRKRSRSFNSNSTRSFSRSRSRSRNRNMRRRSRSRSLSPRYRRREAVGPPNKERRDERHRSSEKTRGNRTNYRGGNRNSRTHYRGGYESNNRPQHDNYQSGHGMQENIPYHDEMQYAERYDGPKNGSDVEHKDPEQVNTLNDQPPPPGEETECPSLEDQKEVTTSDDAAQQISLEKEIAAEQLFDIRPETGEKSNSAEPAEKHKYSKEAHSHSKSEHHKKNREKVHHESSSDEGKRDRKTRDKKKRKKSREHDKHERKKSKKDRKDKSRDKHKTPTADESKLADDKSESGKISKDLNEPEMFDSHGTSPVPPMKEEYDGNISGTEERPTDITEPSTENQSAEESIDENKLNPLKRSDSVLDISTHIDEFGAEFESEWTAPEVSKWELDDTAVLCQSEKPEVSEELEESLEPGEISKIEEKVTSEILKRAENAIFARAINAIRPLESKKIKSTLENSVKETSPASTLIRKPENSSDIKIETFQVTVPTNDDSGARSIEIKKSDGGREALTLKKSPTRPSIKNRLGSKIKSKSRSVSRSPRRRLQSDCKVVKSSKDQGFRSHPERPLRNDRISFKGRSRSSDRSARRNQLTSSCVRVANNRDRDRGRLERKPELRRSKSRSKSRHRRHRTRSRSKGRNDVKKSDQRKEISSHRIDKHVTSTASSRDDNKKKDPSKSDKVDEKRESKQEISNATSNDDGSKSKLSHSVAKKRSRASSTSSTSSSSSSNSADSQTKSKRKHGKVKKKSRSSSADSNGGNSKRKKSKKDKKSKKKKRTRK